MPLLTQELPQVLERIAPDLVRPLAKVKREAIESAMILCQGNISQAAKRLGISRSRLARLIQEWRKEDA